MKKSYIPLLAASLLLSGCHFNWSDGSGVKGSGNVVSQTRTVSGFDRVAVSGSGQLSIVQDNQESLTIETDDNLLPLIKSELSGGWLRIGPDHVNLRPSKTIQYTLHLKNLREVQLSGALGATAPSINTDRLQFGISGSGNIHVDKLEADDLNVQVSGSGDISLVGHVKTQEIHISGSGTYSAADLQSENATISVSGSGDATVWARGALTGHVSGSGDVKYYGSPQVNSQVSGSGSVHGLGNK